MQAKTHGSNGVRLTSKRPRPGAQMSGEGLPKDHRPMQNKLYSGLNVI